jgi:hypothetical protein
VALSVSSGDVERGRRPPIIGTCLRCRDESEGSHGVNQRSGDASPGSLRSPSRADRREQGVDFLVRVASSPAIRDARLPGRADLATVLGMPEGERI